MVKNNYIEIESIQKKIDELNEKEISLKLERAKLIILRKKLLKKCIESKEITIDTLFKLI